MHLDVLDLRRFYYRTRLGRVAQAAIRARVCDHWTEARGQTVAGFGFAVPLLRPFLADARRVVALMPGPQGVMPWPAGLPNVSVLCNETHWPLDTGVVDKLILMHGLETSERQGAVLEECRRVLGPGGRALFIVPDRGGLWARRDGTPFGFGRPYSLGQLETQLRDHGFSPERHSAALYMPPSTGRYWMRTAGLWEGVGQRLSAVMSGGVLLVEATIHSPAPMRPGLPEAVRRPLRILDGLSQPEPAANRKLAGGEASKCRDWR